jgi:hypothetical protein
MTITGFLRGAAYINNPKIQGDRIIFPPFNNLRITGYISRLLGILTLNLKIDIWVSGDRAPFLSPNILSIINPSISAVLRRTRIFCRRGGAGLFRFRPGS